MASFGLVHTGHQAVPPVHRVQAEILIQEIDLHIPFERQFLNAFCHTLLRIKSDG